MHIINLKSFQPLLVSAGLLLLSACGQAASSPTFVNPPTPVSSPAVFQESTCQSLSLEPTPDAKVSSLFPPVSEEDYVTGPQDASMTIIEYSDFQCPACSIIAPVLARLQQEYPDSVRLVYRNFPLLSVHDKAALAAQAAIAAGEQGKFWEMHDLLFATQKEWSPFTPEEFVGWLPDKVEMIGLDRVKFMEDLNREDIAKQVNDAWENGRAIGLPGTPFILINGQIYGGPLDYNNLSKIVSLLAISERQYKSCPPIVINPARQYIARINTEKGEIVVELFADKTPNTVNNFVFLAREGWFDNISFHRVIKDSVAQTGDPTGTGLGHPGYYIDSEIDSSLRYDKPGMVGMANSGPNTNGSQFFITMVPAPNLDGGYTLFGQVISGMDVVSRLTPRDPQSGADLPPGDKIVSITIEER
jgi:cyclophilin family peptidyl-prolyl cis-trans isomerase/protein-disulfide isomerase